MQAKRASADGDNKNAKIRMWLAWGLLALAVIAFIALVVVIVGVRVSTGGDTNSSQ